MRRVVCWLLVTGASAEWTAYEGSSGRWGQSSTLVNNQWLLYGGRTNQQPGYTYNSAPNTADLLSLDLTANFENGAAPWQIWSGEGNSAPTSSFHTLNAWQSVDGQTQITLFGGDDANTPLPTANDSMYTVIMADNEILWTQDQRPTQPMRRIHHTCNTVTVRGETSQFYLGGIRDDGSGIAFNEFWSLSSTNGNLENAEWRLQTSPLPAMYGHTATTLDNSESSLVNIGGITTASAQQNLADLSTIWVYSPPNSAWTAITATGVIPSPRQGHIAAAVNSTSIIIHGGANVDSSEIYDDLFVLSLDLANNAATWTPLASTGVAPSARYGHSALFINQQLVLAFGYGTNSAADAGVYAYSINSDTWTTSFNAGETNAIPANTSPSNNNPSDITQSNGASPSRTQPPISPASTATSTDKQSQPEKSKSSTIAGAVVGIVALGAFVGYGAYFLRRRASGSAFGGNRHQGSGFGSSDAGLLEKARPVAKANHGFAIFGNSPRSNRRFDMLADEDSDADATSHRRGPSSSLTSLRNWGRRIGSGNRSEASIETHTGSDRDGMRIWDGVYNKADNGLKSSKSFMSHALGPWVATRNIGDVTEEDLALSPLGFSEKGGFDSPPLTPRPFGPRDLTPTALYDPPVAAMAHASREASVESDSLNESGTALSLSTLPTSASGHSLVEKTVYSSNFQSPPLIGSFSQPNAPKRSNSWWSRFQPEQSNHNHIRDPNPFMAPVAENPFSDDSENPFQESRAKSPMRVGSQSSANTVSSSMLEQQVANMQVLQRIRTTSDSSLPSSHALDTSTTSSDNVGRQVTDASISRTRPPRQNSSGVRKMVEELEARTSQSPPKRVSRVDHGFVPKEKLFIVN